MAVAPHRSEHTIFNGDMLEWHHAAGASWPNTSGGSTGCTGWYGGPGYGGGCLVTRMGLQPQYQRITGCRFAIRYEWTTAPTQGEDGTPTGWSTILEHGSAGGTDGFIDAHGVRKWAGREVTLEWWISSSGFPGRLVVWQSCGGGTGATAFRGVIAGPEFTAQASLGWQPYRHTFRLPAVDADTIGADFSDYVGVGLDMRAGHGPVIGITGVRVVDVV